MGMRPPTIEQPTSRLHRHPRPERRPTSGGTRRRARTATRTRPDAWTRTRPTATAGAATPARTATFTSDPLALLLPACPGTRLLPARQQRQAGVPGAVRDLGPDDQPGSAGLRLVHGSERAHLSNRFAGPLLAAAVALLLLGGCGEDDSGAPLTWGEPAASPDAAGPGGRPGPAGADPQRHRQDGAPDRDRRAGAGR